MNQQAAVHRKGGLVLAMSILVLLVGTATGNAFAMLVMAVAALAVVGIFYRQELGWTALLTIVVAAVAAAAVAVVLI